MVAEAYEAQTSKIDDIVSGRPWMTQWKITMQNDPCLSLVSRLLNKVPFDVTGRYRPDWTPSEIW